MPSTASSVNLRHLACEIRYKGHLIYGSDFVKESKCRRCYTPFQDLLKEYRQRGLIHGNDTFHTAWQVIVNGHR